MQHDRRRVGSVGHAHPGLDVRTSHTSSLSDRGAVWGLDRTRPGRSAISPVVPAVVGMLYSAGSATVVGVAGFAGWCKVVARRLPFGLARVVAPSVVGRVDQRMHVRGRPGVTGSSGRVVAVAGAGRDQRGVRDRLRAELRAQPDRRGSRALRVCTRAAPWWLPPTQRHEGGSAPSAAGASISGHSRPPGHRLIDGRCTGVRAPRVIAVRQTHSRQ
jgi:hypothetical protein